MDASAPYLPPLEATDNPVSPKKRKAWNNFSLWVLLIVMFLAIYQWFATPTPADHAVPTPPSPDASWSNALIGLLAALGSIAVVILLLWRQFRGGVKLNRKLEPGLLALADGDLGRAAEVFAAVAREYRKQTLYALHAKLSLSTTLMRQGELHKATDVAIEVERAPSVLFYSSGRGMAAIHLGMLYALRGQLDAATRWCEDARRRLARGQHRTVTAAALLRLAEVMVLARSGQRDEAARALDRDWRRLEEALCVTTMKQAWLVRAYCAAGEGTRGSVEPWLTMARSGTKGELRWLGTAWPELSAFIDAHDL